MKLFGESLESLAGHDILLWRAVGLDAQAHLSMAEGFEISWFAALSKISKRLWSIGRGDPERCRPRAAIDAGAAQQSRPALSFDQGRSDVRDIFPESSSSD